MSARSLKREPLSDLTADELRNVHDTLNLMRAVSEEHFDMRHWFKVEGDDDREFMSLDDADEVSITACGTTACLAGFAVLAGAPTFPDPAPEDWSTVSYAGRAVARWLGMDDDRLFLQSEWPWQLQQRIVKRGLSEYQVITEHMSELVRGVRRHWLDFDTAAVEVADRQDVER